MISVKELKQLCEEQIARGNGNIYTAFVMANKLIEE